MTHNAHNCKSEYGDFQTPNELAKIVCQQLVALKISPDVIIEPTCGQGNFIDAASQIFTSARRIIGIEINLEHLQECQTKKQLLDDRRIELQQADFFKFDWEPCLKQINGKLLVLGNFPWVTNSQQGTINSENLPKKNNFQAHTGLDAITGKSNFDISEWMLIQTVQWLQKRNGWLAMLCKTSVARKLLGYIHSKNFNLAYCATYKIDAKKYFDAAVESCLLLCEFDLSSKNYFCDVFSSLGISKCYQIGYRNQVLVRDIPSFEKLSNLYKIGIDEKWRSGIKHDCSKVMEFRRVDNTLINGLGENIELEENYLFPLLKGSDVAQNRIRSGDRYVLVTQKIVGESTEFIRDIAPKTWNYLESHSSYLDNRKSRIYQKNPRFSIFGVGSYTFAPWKIGICGLYKKLEFRLVGTLVNKPIVFDDTVYFLSFNNEQLAYKTFKLLTSPSVIEFYSSLIFWDDKRPIKSSILNSLNLKELIKNAA